MSVRRLIVGLVIVLATTATARSSSVADLGAFEMRQGPLLTLRDSGVDEYAAVLRRDLSKRTPAIHTATFEVTYIDFTPEAQQAFQAAVDVWSTLISSPVTIRVEAKWTPLDGDLLGQAGSALFRAGILPDPNTFYPEPLADALYGSDIRPGEFDITAEFDSDRSNWYLGTDGLTPPGTTDFMTVVLHELGHGLGFLGLANVENGLGSWGTRATRRSTIASPRTATATPSSTPVSTRTPRRLWRLSSRETASTGAGVNRQPPRERIARDCGRPRPGSPAAATPTSMSSPTRRATRTH